MKSYHRVWLLAHPERSEEWLRERLADGFDIHHLDGDHENDAPNNLVLIEASDHMSLHGGRVLRRLSSGQKWTTICRGASALVYWLEGKNETEIRKLMYGGRDNEFYGKHTNVRPSVRKYREWLLSEGYV